MRATLLLCAGLLAGCSGQALLNALTPASGYTLAPGIVYDDATRLRLDVYTPAGAQQAPVVVFFFGGRWSAGSRDGYKFVGEALASRGFVTVIPDYRLYPAVKFPAFVDDAAHAVRWTHDTVARYGGDPQKLFVMGHSSGAHLAAMLALDRSRLEKAGGSRAWLRGMIGLAGPYDFLPLTAPDLRDMFGPPEKFEASQPITYADGSNPPLLLLHGEDDDTVWVRNTRNLAAAVSKAGGPVETVIYPSLSHTMILGALGGPLRGRADVLERVARFVQTQSVAPSVPPPAVKTERFNR